MLVSRDSATMQGPSIGDARIISRDLERNHFNLHNFGKNDTCFHTVELVLRNIVPDNLQSSAKDILQAVLDEDIESVKLALESNRSATSTKDKLGCSPLHLASRKGYFNIAKYLIDHQARVNIPDNVGRTALHYAVISKSPRLVRLLLQVGANGGFQPVTHAGSRGEIAWILENGPHLEAKNFESKTALVHFAEQGNYDAVASLLDQGADMKAQDYNENEPLSLAAGNGHDHITQELLGRGANVDHRKKQGGTALLTSSRHGRVETARSLLSHGANVGVRNHQDFTALIWAALGGHLEVVNLLLGKGHADINEYNQWGMTALCEACKNGHESVVRVLLASGARLDAQNEQNRVPAEEARNHPNICRLLQEARIKRHHYEVRRHSHTI